MSFRYSMVKLVISRRQKLTKTEPNFKTSILKENWTKFHLDLMDLIILSITNLKNASFIHLMSVFDELEVGNLCTQLGKKWCSFMFTLIIAICY